MQTVDKIWTAEFEEKKSRFIGFLLPYSQFPEYLSKLRKEHPKANHFVTAFRAFNDQGQITEGGKDDGEPNGTSGMPALKVLQGNDLINVGAIVVRYFGGTRLGKGGLSRAYANGVKQPLETAVLLPWVDLVTKDIQISFEEISNFETLCQQLNLKILKRDFNENGASILVEGDEVTLIAAFHKIKPY